MLLKYGKEYDASATRLLFLQTLGRALDIVGTVANSFENKN